MTSEEWNEIVKDVALRMRDHVRGFITPISMEVEPEWGELVGTGSYISDGANQFVITNKHVIDQLKGRSGAHHFRENGDDEAASIVVALSKPIASLSPPSDIAIAHISCETWVKEHRASEAIPFNRIAVRHQPVDREILFFAGYPQGHSKSLYKALVTGATPYTTQQPIPETQLDFPDYEFHLMYPTGLIVSLGDDSNGAPLPPGFSGSLVWNTRYAEVVQGGATWTPDCAVVTGVLKKWIEKEELLVVTRVEMAGISQLSQATIGG